MPFVAMCCGDFSLKSENQLSQCIVKPFILQTIIRPNLSNITIDKTHKVEEDSN